jgi:hypothetical protein
VNEGIVTTGLEPLTIGSSRTFELLILRDGVFWNLTGGSGHLLMTAPDGSSLSLPVVIQNSVAVVNWTVVGPVGAWKRAWDVTDATGVREVTQPVAFDVISSPS